MGKVVKKWSFFLPQKMYIRAPAGVIHRVTTPFLDNGNRLDVSEFKFIRTKPTDGLSYPGCW